MKTFHATILSAAMLAAAAGAAGSAQAQSAADFYKNKQMSIIVSTGSGGGYDTLARALARYLPKYIPGNPTFVVQNMPGGGHMLAANYMYNVAAKDGSIISALNQNVPSHQVLDGNGVRYDAGKFIWLGRFTESNPVMALWHTAPVNTIEEAMKTEIIIGATGDGSSSYRYTTALNSVLGTKFKIIKGYKTVPELLVAMERGEIQGRAGGLSAYEDSNPEWITDKKIKFLVQIGTSRDADMKDVPLWTEIAKTEEQRQILNLVASPTNLGRPVNTPPGVPADRVAILRKALEETVKDQHFIEEGKKLAFETEFRDWQETTKIVAETMQASPDVVAKAQVAMK
ncbi:MAG TPA: tripartite tricarboxylate transporter substrate-binding protein [Alphaproteobacteria bacterium]|jgi:tripartite-type tricarboxylate transporter receptor subunit TctC